LKCTEVAYPAGIEHERMIKMGKRNLSAALQAAYVPKRLFNACTPEPQLQSAPHSFRFPGLPIRAHPYQVAIGNDLKDRRRQGGENCGRRAQSI
jgi:hypothetical protein